MTAVFRRPRYDLVGAAHDYPLWSGPPRRSILLCSHQRSGSTMLGEALYFAGGLGCPLEYLHSGFRSGFERRWGVTGLAALAEATWRHRTDPTGTLAIKLFWVDLCDIAAELAPDAFPDLRVVPAAQVRAAEYRELAALLRRLLPDPVHIHLERRDTLRQAVSWFVAIGSGRWRSIPSVEQGAGEPVPYDRDAIAVLLDTIGFCRDHWAAFFAANGIRPLAVRYEELAADHAATVGRLLAALGRPAGAVPAVRMERQSTAQADALMRRFLRDQAPRAAG